MRKGILALLAIVILLGASQKSSAQELGFMFSAGVESSGMSDMIYLQEHILSTYPVEGKISSAFPPFTSISATVFKQLYNYLRVGAGYGYASTGGKSSYADYSGSIYTKMSATSHRLSAYLSYLLLGGDRLNVSLSGTLDANFT